MVKVLKKSITLQIMIAMNLEEFCQIKFTHGFKFNKNLKCSISKNTFLYTFYIFYFKISFNTNILLHCFQHESQYCVKALKYKYQMKHETVQFKQILSQRS